MGLRRRGLEFSAGLRAELGVWLRVYILRPN